MTVQAVIHGLSPGDHGFHVHQTDDFSDGCTSTGGHYNPTNGVAAAVAGSIDEREVGDLGTIYSNNLGIAHFNRTDPLI